MPNNPLEKAKNSIELSQDGSPAGVRPGLTSGTPAFERGRAVWSVVMGLIIVVIAGFLFWINAHRNGLKNSSARPAAVDKALLREIPTAKFTDVTAAAGIHFVHNDGSYGEKLLPETTGGGCAFFDFDN